MTSSLKFITGIWSLLNWTAWIIREITITSSHLTPSFFQNQTSEFNIDNISPFHFKPITVLKVMIFKLTMLYSQLQVDLTSLTITKHFINYLFLPSSILATWTPDIWPSLDLRLPRREGGGHRRPKRPSWLRLKPVRWYTALYVLMFYR